MQQPWDNNPFAILTFIAAPAILTNASSVMTLGTSNRFARAIDRVRALSALVERHKTDPDPDYEMHVRQLHGSERRALILVRALTSFYVSVGSFAAASLISLLGAVFFLAHQDALRQVTLWGALLAGIGGVGGLVCGSTLLVRETRLTLRILTEETERMLKRAGFPTGSPPTQPHRG